jgi:hypothetical protein
MGSPLGQMLATLDDEDLARLAQRLRPMLDGPADGDRLYTAHQAAVYLRCDVQRIYELRRTGKLVPELDGRRLLFRRHVLDSHIAVRDGSMSR